MRSKNRWPPGGNRRPRRNRRAETPREYSYLLFNKPYGVLSQFTPVAGRIGLASFGPFPRGVYPAGRLDWDSEGLLFLTDDGSMKHRLINPRFGHWRTYVVQVEGTPTLDALAALQKGVTLSGRRTQPARVRRLDGEPEFWERPVRVRHRLSVPTSWLEIELREGRNRQVRRMTAAVGHPALRLIRTAIGPLRLVGLVPGQWRRLSPAEVSALTNDVGLPAQKETPGHE